MKSQQCEGRRRRDRGTTDTEEGRQIARDSDGLDGETEMGQKRVCERDGEPAAHGSVSRVRQEQQGKSEVGNPANREYSGHSGHSVGPGLEPNRQGQ